MNDPLLYDKIGFALALYLCAYFAAMVKGTKKSDMKWWSFLLLITLTISLSVFWGVMAINGIVEIVKKSL